MNEVETPFDPVQFQALIGRLTRWFDDLEFAARLAEEKREERRLKRLAKAQVEWVA